jgi:hypothetical protein
VVSNLSLSSSSSAIASSQAHQIHVSALSGPSINPYPASYPRPSAKEPTVTVSVSCYLSATGIRFLDLPAPAGGLDLPHGRLTGPQHPDPIGVVMLRMSKTRPGRAPP